MGMHSTVARGVTGKTLRVALLASTALVAAALPASAQDATWLAAPGSGDYNNATNWDAGAVPAGTAVFGSSNITGLSLSAIITNVGGWTFNAGASAYTFSIDGNLLFTGAGIVVSGGSAAITNTIGGSLGFLNTSTAGSATIINNYFAVFANTSTAGSAAITNNRQMRFTQASTAGSAAITNNDNLHFVDTSTAGSAAITNNAGGRVDFSGSTGPAGDHKLSAGSIAGAGNYVLGVNELTVGSNDLSTEVSGVISGAGGSLVKTGTGTLTLSGDNAYTGATTVNAGTLEVDGSIAASSSVTVNAGGTLSGTGIVGSPATTTIMSGGTLAPGNAGNPTGALTITGSLAFQSGALYVVHVTPASASSANVSGAAPLGGATVGVVFASGSYVARQYTILTAAGGVSGTFAPSLVSTNLPAGFQTSLSYDANDVFLNLRASLGNGASLNANQQNVAGSVNDFFNNGGALPPAFLSLFGSSGGALANGLTQASGELGTGAQQTTFGAMSQFTGLLTDPFMARDGRAGAAPGAAGFAEEGEGASASTANKRDAFAMIAKVPVPAFVQRWSVWASGFGGAQSTDGNAVVGANDTTSRIFGTAVGADYLFSPNTLAGFALAGGGTSFSIANGLGGGRSDLFQAGAYLRHTSGPAYISAALAYGWQDITTDRTVTIAGVDRLRAAFNANAYSGRVEGGYRFVAPLPAASASRPTRPASSRPSICPAIPSRRLPAPTRLRWPMAPKA